MQEPGRHDRMSTARAVQPGSLSGHDQVQSGDASSLDLGRFVRSKGSGRRGIIEGVVTPPRNGRSRRVSWSGTPDFSLMAPWEIEVDPDPPPVRVRDAELPEGGSDDPR
jgi:hypothetical protein